MNYWSLKVNEICFLSLYFLIFASDREVLTQEMVYEEKPLMASYIVVVQFQEFVTLW